MAFAFPGLGKRRQGWRRVVRWEAEQPAAMGLGMEEKERGERKGPLSLSFCSLSALATETHSLAGFPTGSVGLAFDVRFRNEKMFTTGLMGKGRFSSGI